MNARLPLALLAPLALAAGLAGCAGPVPSAESECLARLPTWATFQATYPPLYEDWEAQAMFEEHGWVVQPDAGEGSRADEVLFYAAHRPGEELELRAFVQGGSGQPTFVHVEALGTSVVTASAAEEILRPYVKPLEQALSARLGAAIERVGYFGGDACAT